MLPGIFFECDEILSNAAHVPVSPTIDNVFSDAFVVGGMRYIMSYNIFCCILYITLYSSISWAAKVSIAVV